MKISDYKSLKGFHDLRNYGLSVKMFKKLWKIQCALLRMEENKTFYKNQHPEQWQKAQELSAEYQNILLEKQNENEIKGE